ncbi:MAG: HIT family protein [Bacteroidales bacterium]|nr:HIT family protein [Bacteroidales bacterium]
MNENNTCPFCNTDILDYAFLESNNFLAVYNIAPVLPGHSLIIPRVHFTSFMELSDGELYEFISFSRKAIRILSGVFQTESFNWILQEKEEAGQTIAHMHIHIIPRKPGDMPEPGDWYPRWKNNISHLIDSNQRPRLSRDEMKTIVDRLRKAAADAVS